MVGEVVDRLGGDRTWGDLDLRPSDGGGDNALSRSGSTSWYGAKFIVGWLAFVRSCNQQWNERLAVMSVGASWQR